MNSAVSVLSVLLFASLVPAQDKPSAPAASPRDKIQQEAAVPARGEAGLPACPSDMRLCPPGRQDMPMAPGMMGPRCCGAPFVGPQNGGQMGGPCFAHCRPHFFLVRALLLLLLMVGTVNILMTIIVSLDMAHSGRFNGLWIPVLLIVGMPGSAIYALFRIGDKMQGRTNI